MTLRSHRHPPHRAADTSRAAASLAQLESVGGFFDEVYEYPGLADSITRVFSGSEERDYGTKLLGEYLL